MLKIKLSRIGKKDHPEYRIIIAEAKSKRDGKYVDKIGYYNPQPDKPIIKIDEKAYKKWLEKGAQPTKTVRHLFEKLTN